jgi:hypothetical protein
VTLIELYELISRGGLAALVFLLAIAVHRGWLRLGREVVDLEKRLLLAERRAERWESLALSVTTFAEKAVGIRREREGEP